MRIFPSRRIGLKSSSLSQGGLSLIEILVALVLASLLFYVALTAPGRSEQDDLDESMDIVEKAIIFAINESILRNRMTRVHFDLEAERPKISVEYSDDIGFVLPDVKKYDKKDLGIKEKEAKEKMREKINSRFKPVEDIDPERLNIPEQVQILGMATSLRPSVVRDEEMSIYIYPTGERDRAFITFALFEHIAAFMTEPYLGEFNREYATIKLENESEEAYEESYREILEKLFEKW
ncbi:MAG: prepilin-type N-terminal cleavage/methylation domain-containing protein [Bacteriovoracales bacterium]|nr:prepilin-type N-terminal cleavage/methylation domain-containing protein [Bacteriovoracales bacterium]